MNKRALGCFGSLLLLLGCGDGIDGSEPGDDRQQNIIGGVPTTGDPAVVALYGKKPGEDRGVLCTATLIAPTVVLTAAHCVHPQTAGTGLEYNVLLGSDLTDPDNPSPGIKVTAFHYDPEFDPSGAGLLLNGHDIAVAILETPHSATPIPWNRDPLAMTQVNQPVRLVGYGLNDGFRQTGAGIKRQATVTLKSFTDKLVRTGTLTQRICSGDSGGPVLLTIAGRETVVGVNSFGFIFCLGDGLSTRVDRYVDFVEQYLP